MEVPMAKTKSKHSQGESRDQRRIRIQQWVFIIISILIVLTMLAMLASSL
jgi:hypothetical protein